MRLAIPAKIAVHRIAHHLRLLWSAGQARSRRARSTSEGVTMRTRSVRAAQSDDSSRSWRRSILDRFAHAMPIRSTSSRTATLRSPYAGSAAGYTVRISSSTRITLPSTSAHRLPRRTGVICEQHIRTTSTTRCRRPTGVGDDPRSGRPAATTGCCSRSSRSIRGRLRAGWTVAVYVVNGQAGIGTGNGLYTGFDGFSSTLASWAIDQCDQWRVTGERFPGLLGERPRRFLCGGCFGESGSGASDVDAGRRRRTGLSRPRPAASGTSQAR